MAELQSKPSPDTPQPSTNDVDGQGQASLKDRLKKFLGSPILSLLVGGALLICEAIIVILALADPESVGISEVDALTAAQRGVLGGVSIIILIEAIFFGIVDIATNRKKARLLKAQRKSQLNQLSKLQSTTEDPAKSIVQVAKLLKEQILSSENIKHKLDPTNLEEIMEETEKILEEAVNHHTLKYIGYLVFDLATFLWKWALALLIISNNWLSVVVTIAGGVVYPLVVFWQKAIDPTP